MPWKVYYFQTKSGRLPVKEFVDMQNIKARARIKGAIKVLGENGPFLKPPYIKKLQAGLYELRIKGRVAIRIFYSPKNATYYLLHAFKKKSQKTPARELKTALDRMKEMI